MKRFNSNFFVCYKIKLLSKIVVTKLRIYIKLLINSFKSKVRILSFLKNVSSRCSFFLIFIFGIFLLQSHFSFNKKPFQCNRTLSKVLRENYYDAHHDICFAHVCEHDTLCASTICDLLFVTERKQHGFMCHDEIDGIMTGK